MAEGQSMTVADVVAQVRDGRLEDFVREAVALVAREVMEAEISAEIGAELGEVAPERRLTHRNAYRERSWETRVGAGRPRGGRKVKLDDRIVDVCRLDAIRGRARDQLGASSSRSGLTIPATESRPRTTE